MNQKGQAGSAFRLLAFAITAIAIIYIVLQFFLPQQTDALKELREAIENAQANAGIGATKTIFFEKNFAVRAEIFDTEIRSVSFQCHAQECAGKKFEVAPRNFVVLENVSVQYTPRCVFEKNLFNCKIYFGTPPAQLKIPSAKINKAQRGINFEITLQNTGLQNALEPTIEVKVFKKEQKDGKTIENLYGETIIENFQIIAPLQSKQKNFTVTISDAGEFSAHIKAFGNDAGEDFKKIEFSFQATPRLNDCSADKKLESFLNETQNKCITRHSCTGCEYAFECANKWRELFPQLIFEEASKELAYEIKEPENGTC
ncbi:MAG: hypothetical protein HYW50_04675 [Candidatus Diapherotrites archaeon]|nr:hypothetical protein [Candidatus Diapherotrites archaeon]